MEMRIEVTILPVADVERAKDFYARQLGFIVDHDRTFDDDMRMVQLTPPGSGCSIQIGKGITNATPGSAVTTLVVNDIAPVHQAFVDRGVDVTEVQALGGFPMAFFTDPDGNRWILQEIRRPN